MLRHFAATTALVMAAALGQVCAQSTADRSWIISPFDIDHARQAVTAHASNGLEGIWRASADGATVAIIASDAPGTASAANADGATLIIVIVESPDPAIAPGTVMGWAKMAAKPGKWDATIFTASANGTLSAPRPFTLTVTDHNHLTMASARTGWRLQLWKALPYLWRSPLGERNERERDLDGFIRLWPVDRSTPPPFPTYL
ncbi:MAG: hypothetical protein K2O10_00875 [Muribaculaceae bacterium]|nr:hypothetical protein [Muribaculaceae bacterium]